MRLGGSALVDLGGLPPELRELTVLFALCGGMGTGPLMAVGVKGSIALGFVSLDSTEKIKQHCQKEAHNDPKLNTTLLKQKEQLSRDCYKLC